MKFLLVLAFEALNSVLSRLDTGECLIHGKIEAYSCKSAGTDKKLFKTLNTSLGHQLENASNSGSSSSNNNNNNMASSNAILTPPNGFATNSISSSGITLSSSAGGLGDSLGDEFQLERIPPCYLSLASPFGPLSDTGARRTFISLIQVLNASYPDYDWSSLPPSEFRREDPNTVRNAISIGIPALSLDGVSLQARVWNAIDTEIRIAECEIFSYRPDPDNDPLARHRTLWYFDLFFYNRRLKRVIFFTCRSLAKVSLSSAGASEALSDDEDAAGYSYDDKLQQDMDNEL